MITLYAYNTPNGRKIPVALEEMGLPYRVQIVDITKGQQMEPAFLAISPNNRIPAITDDEGPASGGLGMAPIPGLPDAAPIHVFESGAILLYLGEKSGKFLPADLRARVPVLEWLMWQMGGFGPMLGQFHHFAGLPDEADRRYGVARYGAEVRRLYGVLDRRLGEMPFVADALSVADFACLGWAWRHEKHGIDLADYPHVRRWYDTLMDRPGVQRGFAVALS